MVEWVCRVFYKNQRWTLLLEQDGFLRPINSSAKSLLRMLHWFVDRFKVSLRLQSRWIASCSSINWFLFTIFVSILMKLCLQVVYWLRWRSISRIGDVLQYRNEYVKVIAAVVCPSWPPSVPSSTAYQNSKMLRISNLKFPTILFKSVCIPLVTRLILSRRNCMRLLLRWSLIIQTR